MTNYRVSAYLKKYGWSSRWVESESPESAAKQVVDKLKAKGWEVENVTVETREVFEGRLRRCPVFEANFGEEN